MNEQTRQLIRTAMAAPDRNILFLGDGPESVLSLETLGHMAAIVEGARDRLTLAQVGAAEVDLEALYLAACYHAVRVSHLPGNGGHWDHRASVLLFSALHAVRPEAVPEPMRGAFAARPPTPATPGEILHSVALVLVGACAPARHQDGLWQAAAMIEHARKTTPPEELDPVMTFNLGSVLATLSDLTGTERLIVAASGLMREAVAAMPDHRPPPAAMLTALASAQAKAAAPGPSDRAETLDARLGRYTRTGGQEQLDTIVAEVRGALAATADDDPERHAHRTSLGNLLRMRFENTGDLSDLEESVQLLRDVVETADDATMRHLAGSWLGLSFLDRFITLKDRVDLERATAAVRQSMAGSAPLSPHHSRLLTNLAAVLIHRFTAYGELSEITEAIRHLEHAVAATPPDQHDRPVMRIKLAVARGARARESGWMAELDRAVAELRAVAEETEGTGPHPQLARLELGRLLTERSAMSGAPSDLESAVAAFRTTAMAPTEDIRTRLAAAFHWAVRSAASGDPQQARTAFTVALDDLLPKLTGRTLPRRSREMRLRELPSLACNAAAVEIEDSEGLSDERLEVQRLEDALLRLEQGRGVLMAQALRLRERHTELTEAAPELAARFDRVCAEVAEERGSRERRGALTVEFDRIVAEIRGIDGFERFQMPPDRARLRTTAAHGPVVVLNVAELRCDALLLRPDTGGVELVALKGLTRKEIAERADDFLAAVRALSSPSSEPAGRGGHRLMVETTLTWLWEHIAGPVLTALGIYDEKGSPKEVTPEEMPRLWWCPTGPLSLLPLHAALCPADGLRVHDHVVSSYTPTLMALLHARERTEPPLADTRLIGVGVGEPPSPTRDGRTYPRLPAVEAELAAVSALPVPQSRLLDAEATPEDVLAALRGHHHAHLACHGEYDPDDPSNSRLLLHGGELTVRELATRRLPDAEFACLSACHTAAPGTALVDEVITVASAFQLCGYRHVLGSLWTVADAMMPRLAEQVYRELGAAGSTARSAYALHRATHSLRAQPEYAAPWFWASMIHIGP
ncbi:CHAT domain-containing protein [Streptomyces sp. NA02950]|uniref:CHAT domain-containing protein n=1 Tax=Streptomyces sp. NA02950 TaxID=2742137 RepID=UPI001591DB7E|nr:CHAT domain-containing protein [Streptomyces sp. NA02950]QKV96775.1 CHAT domain-containing protein [Streptomyces sp. NA02950]